MKAKTLRELFLLAWKQSKYEAHSVDQLYDALNRPTAKRRMIYVFGWLQQEANITDGELLEADKEILPASELTDYELAKRGRFHEIKARYKGRNCGSCIYWSHTGTLLGHVAGLCAFYGSFNWKIAGCPPQVENQYQRRSK